MNQLLVPGYVMRQIEFLRREGVDLTLVGMLDTDEMSLAPRNDIIAVDDKDSSIRYLFKETK